MNQPFKCPLCAASFAPKDDSDDWRDLPGIRLVEHLAVDHEMGPRGAWLYAKGTLCGAEAPAERERERDAWSPDDVIGLTELAMELTSDASPIIEPME